MKILKKNSSMLAIAEEYIPRRKYVNRVLTPREKWQSKVPTYRAIKAELRARDSDGGLEVAPRSVYGNVRSMFVLPG
jgi:hypothetical protein